MNIVHVETSVHGRILHEPRSPERLLVGFHGYGEGADAIFGELSKIPGVEAWSVAAVQALHPFYTRAGNVVANWMTSQDRELAIADNLAYVRAAFGSLPPARRLVLLGFSQGATMASRAAAYAARPDGLILLGGDLPPRFMPIRTWCSLQSSSAAGRATSGTRTKSSTKT
jgi:predicted esterase